ncbi:MAG: RNA polymerase sigma factor [Bacteroidota bacterium]
MGRPPSFDELYAQYASLVYNLCIQYVQHAPTAEELTQDVFVKIYQQLSRFKGKSSLKTWIYRITINHCLDHLKAQKRQKRFGRHVGLEEAPVAHFDHPGVTLEDQEALAQLFAHINELPDRQKTALLLKAVDGLPQREIAEIMQLGIKAVESLLSRAKATLRKKINTSEGSPS